MLIKRIALCFALVISANFSFSQEKRVNVYAFVTEECPISIFMASSLKNVAEIYGSKVNFYLVFPFSTSSNKTAAAFKTENLLTTFIIKIDKEQRLTKKLGATVTPEVVITGANDSILYRGRINDAYDQPGKRKHIYSSNDLATALDSITNGREMPRPWKRAVGCFITPETEQP
jgi:hypothetical protein